MPERRRWSRALGWGAGWCTGGTAGAGVHPPTAAGAGRDPFLKDASGRCCLRGSPERRDGRERDVGAAAGPCPYPSLHLSRDVPSPNPGGLCGDPSGDVPWAGAGQDCSYLRPSSGTEPPPHAHPARWPRCSAAPRPGHLRRLRFAQPPLASPELLPQQLRAKNSPERGHPPQRRSAAAAHRHRAQGGKGLRVEPSPAARLRGQGGVWAGPA